jgi:putative transposase
MRRFAGCRRFVHNKGLALQKTRLDAKGKIINSAQLCAALVVWKNEPQTAWLKEVPSYVLQQSVKDFDRAFNNFFVKRAAFPKFHKKGRGEAFRFPDPKQFEINQANGRIKLPKLGWLRYYDSRPVEGLVKNVAISAEADEFYVSIQTERVIANPETAVEPMVGLDLGIARFAALSDGTYIEPLS